MDDLLITRVLGSVLRTEDVRDDFSEANVLVIVGQTHLSLTPKYDGQWNAMTEHLRRGNVPRGFFYSTCICLFLNRATVDDRVQLVRLRINWNLHAFYIRLRRWQHKEVTPYIM